jgi:hypothetical protein
MSCTRNLKRQKRNATLVVESLDDRVVLSAASAVGLHAAAAVEVTRAATESAGLIQRFDAALDGINGLVNRGLNHFNGQVNNQIGGVDAVTQALFGQTVAGINNFASVNVASEVANEAALNRVAIAIVNPFDRFISTFDVGLNRFTREINNRLVLLGRQFDTADSALESPMITATANVQAEEVADSGRWLSELQAGRANLQNEIDSARTAIASADPPQSPRTIVKRTVAGTATAGIGPTATPSGTNEEAGVSPFALDPVGIVTGSGNGTGTDMTDTWATLFS